MEVTLYCYDVYLMAFLQQVFSHFDIWLCGSIDDIASQGSFLVCVGFGVGTAGEETLQME